MNKIIEQVEEVELVNVKNGLGEKIVGAAVGFVIGTVVASLARPLVKKLRTKLRRKTEVEPEFVED